MATSKVKKPATISKILSHVDVVKSGMVEGWVWDQTNASRECVVAAFCEGKLLTELPANIFRNDLLANGIGNGKHGFRLSLPSPLVQGRSIELLEMQSGAPLHGSPVRFPELDLTNSIRQDRSLLLIDLSDFFRYLDHYDQPTGIQRVQANVFNAIVEEALVPLSQIRVLYYKESEQDFFEMAPEFAIDLIADSRRDPACRQFERHADKSLHLESIVPLKPLQLDAAAAANAQLLVLGAAWGLPGYFDLVRKLKRRGTRFVSLIHDLIPIVLPSMCDKDNTEVFKLFLHRAVRNADYMLAISEHTRRDLLAYCEAGGYACPPVGVAKNGQSLGSKFHDEKTLPVHGPFVLFVSTIEGRKNHRLAMQMWEQLIARHGDDIPALVFVGKLGWRVEALVEELYEKNFLNQKITILTDVSDGLLASLYKNCLFTLFPSLYEGWGLPVGESLAFHKVCLASNTSAIPESGGSLAVYFDPANLSDAVDKAARLITDHQWRQQLEEKIAAEFVPITWADTAKAVIAGVTAAKDRSPSPTIPLLEVGEYNFAKVPVLKSGNLSGEEIARHFQDFAQAHLTPTSLSLNSYLLAEEALAEGVWPAPEDWGRWARGAGGSLHFRVAEALTSGLLILKLQISASMLPAVVQFSCCGKRIENRRFTKSEVLVQLKSTDFCMGDEIHLQFKITSSATPLPFDGSDEGAIGLSRMALIQGDSLVQRLEVLERLMFD